MRGTIFMDRRRELGKRQRRSTGVGSKSKMVPERARELFQRVSVRAEKGQSIEGFRLTGGHVRGTMSTTQNMVL